MAIWLYSDNVVKNGRKYMIDASFMLKYMGINRCNNSSPPCGSKCKMACKNLLIMPIESPAQTGSPSPIHRLHKTAKKNPRLAVKLS